MNIPETINAVNAVYHYKTDLTALERGVKDLENVLFNMQPNQTNKENAEALLYRLKAKIFALKYFDGGYLEEDFRGLQAYLTEVTPKAEGAGYVKTTVLCKSLLSVAEAVYDVMMGAVGEIYRVRDDEGNPTTSNVADLESVRAAFEARANKLADIPDTKTLFGEKVVMIDVKERAIADVNEIVNWAERAIRKINGQTNEQFFKNNVKNLEDEEGLNFFDYYPSLPDRENTTAHAIVAMSPFRDEVLLFARAYARQYSLQFVSVHASAFAGTENLFIDSFFEEIAQKKFNLILFGLPTYHDANKPYLLEKTIRFTNGYGVAICVDDKGDRKVYDDMFNIAKEADGLDVMDVSYKYLTMPNYHFVISEFEQKGMITGADYSFVQKHMAFMGFVGFNTAVSLHVQGRGWRDEAIDISSRHEQLSAAYLKYLPSQAQLIDVAWRDLALERDTSKVHKEFDYDSVRAVNPKNIQKILQMNVSLFAKIGLMVKYCCLCGEDISVWPTLSVSEKSARLTDASRLVCFLLDNEYSPEIEVIPEEKWENKTAGAVCCDGGKRIIYREDCCMDYEWTIDAVCHECYHGFQFTLENHGWKEWHYIELGVTEYRVPEWQFNTSNYKDSRHGNAYKVQVLESDARAFAKDCIMQSANYWHLLDLE